jgi:hypothetical protein
VGPRHKLLAEERHIALLGLRVQDASLFAHVQLAIGAGQVRKALGI